YMGYIDRDQLLAEACRFGGNDYGRYLANLLE
ncbi:MAG: glucose-1-phosphate thymidylyltransferase, partial [Alphaproteobacteria bacterium]|nr:glucose-1-phosphate thymidylyltransferase [Alphaproteobacteria bacterium]